MSVKEKKIMLHFNVCSSTTLHLNYRTQSFPYIQGKTYSPLPLNEFENRAWLSQNHEVSEHLLHFQGAASCIHLLFQPVRCGLPSLQVTTRTFQYYDLYPLIRSFALLALTKVNFLSWYVAFKRCVCQPCITVYINHSNSKSSNAPLQTYLILWLCLFHTERIPGSSPLWPQPLILGRVYLLLWHIWPQLFHNHNEPKALSGV